MSNKRYAWVDLETTGSNEDTDQIIEVGVALAESIGDEFPYAVASYAVHVDYEQIKAAPVAVQEMHEKNDLWADAIRSKVTVTEVDRIIDRWLAALTGEKPERQFILCGSGVGHFDSRFIRRQMPLFSGWLTYWTIDVGVVRRFLRLCDIDVPHGEEGKKHRALDDALRHMDEGRLYREIIMKGRM